MTEYEFFHRASRTLVLTDFIENFELRKVDSRLMRWFIRLGGANGEAPRDMRLFDSRTTLRGAVEAMIGWEPEPIVLAHGRWYERDAVGELRRAFGWLLPRPRDARPLLGSSRRSPTGPRPSPTRAGPTLTRSREPPVSVEGTLGCGQPSLACAEPSFTSLRVPLTRSMPSLTRP